MSPIISTYPNFISAINAVQQHLRYWGVHVETESWQGINQAKKFFEALNVSFSVQMPKIKETLHEDINPNMPWAEDHFKERICGAGLNPGNQYRNWPYYKNNPSNDKFRTTKGDKFSHTYMERFWPKNAGNGPTGIRFEVGDYKDLQELLYHQPFTRQAYLPIWFPEDGFAAIKGERVPCTLGYHFLRRRSTLNITYYIRSCDFFRHFRDDIYMACRLVLDLIECLADNESDAWNTQVTPGTFTMHITSLHIFSSEYKLL